MNSNRKEGYSSSSYECKMFWNLKLARWDIKSWPFPSATMFARFLNQLMVCWERWRWKSQSHFFAVFDSNKKSKEGKRACTQGEMSRKHSNSDSVFSFENREKRKQFLKGRWETSGSHPHNFEEGEAPRKRSEAKPDGGSTTRLSSQDRSAGLSGCVFLYCHFIISFRTCSCYISFWM